MTTTNDSLYGTDKPHAKPTQVPHPDEPIADALYDKPASKTPYWLSDLDGRRKEAFSTWGSTDELDKLTTDAVAIANATNESIAATVARAYFDSHLRVARTGENADDQAERDKRTHDHTLLSREWFLDAYGNEDGPRMLARTQKFVRNTPALAKLLQQYGLGSNPAIVEQIAAYVFSNGLGR